MKNLNKLLILSSALVISTATSKAIKVTASSAATSIAAPKDHSTSPKYIPSKEERDEIDKLKNDLANSKIDQVTINAALRSAAIFNQQAIVEFLLSRPDGQLRPDQTGINDAINGAAISGQQAMVEFLLSRPEGQLKPNQESINDALELASELNHQAIVDFLLSRPDGQLRPDQTGINNALKEVVGDGLHTMVEYLLNRPSGQLRPDQACIVKAYRHAVVNENAAIIRILEPLVPLEEKSRVH